MKETEINMLTRLRTNRPFMDYMRKTHPQESLAKFKEQLNIMSWTTLQVSLRIKVLKLLFVILPLFTLSIVVSGLLTVISALRSRTVHEHDR